MLERTVELNKEDYGKLIDQREAGRYLGYGKAEPDQEIKLEMARCSERLLPLLRPRYHYMRGALKWEGQLAAVLPENAGELLLPGNSIRRHLEGCENVLCACLTLGAETDELIESAQQESMLEALLFDGLANAAAERLRFLLEEQAAADFPEFEINWLFGIGYGDLPVTLQGEFLKAIRGEKIGLSCNDKNILIPLKSVTGFIGLKNEKNRKI